MRVPSSKSASASKSSPTVKKVEHRSYTGNSDGLATGATAGLVELVHQITSRSNNALWNNGTFVNRPMRGKESLSVHATGRAVDLSWRKIEKKGRKNGRLYAEKMMNFLVENADALGIEMIIDYNVSPFGRGWRCDRNAWEIYTKETVHGTPTGDWFHVEISPEMSAKPQMVSTIFEQKFVFEQVYKDIPA